MPTEVFIAIAVLPSVVVFLAGCLLALSRTIRVQAGNSRRVERGRRTT